MGVVASGGSALGGVVLTFFLLFLVAAVVALVLLLRGERLRFETKSTPDQVTMAAVGEVARKRHWTTLTQGSGTVTFSYFKRPNIFLVIVLVIFVISIPLAILYVILATKRESLSVFAALSAPGVTAVQITSNGWRGKGGGRTIRRQLGVTTIGVPVRSAPAVAATSALQIPAAQPAELPPTQQPTFATVPAASSRLCAGCGQPMGASVRFCETCGTKAPAVCNVCGHPTKEDAKFCQSCGTAVAAPV